MDSYLVVILKEAQLDLEEIIEWYEEQQEGLGETFFVRYEYITGLLARNPYLFPDHLLFVRRALVSRTPYAIYYAIDEPNKQAEVIAVLHQKRDPDLLRKRINL